MLGKKRLKEVLYGYEVRTTAIIGNGLVHHVPKQQTLKLIRKELLRVSKYADLSSSETNQLGMLAYNQYVRVSKKVFSSLRKAENADLEYEEKLILRKNAVYAKLKEDFKSLEHIKNDAANLIEARNKRDSLQEMMSEGIFYLCSSHINPAKDHKDWEGKVYVNEDWETRCDQDMHGKIEAYIRNHDVKTVQWVTGEPVYLVTRPNCKHYFVPVSVEEVLGSSVKKLLKSHNMYMQDEKELSYEYIQYKNYYERLKVLSYLKSMFDAEDLDKDIKATRLLVKRWGNRAKQLRS